MRRVIGTMTAFATGHSSWATGLSSTPSPSADSDQTRAFEITATVRDDNAARAKTAEPAFTWPIRSN